MGSDDPVWFNNYHSTSSVVDVSGGMAQTMTLMAALEFIEMSDPYCHRRTTQIKGFYFLTKLNFL